MRVLSIFSVLATAALVYAQSATVVIGNLQALTTKSAQLNDLVDSINIANAIFKGPQVSQGLNDIANTIYEFNSQQTTPPPVFNDSDATAIVDNLKSFVQIQKRLFNTIISKHRILSTFLFTDSIRVSLVKLEDAVDAFSLILTDMVPSQASAAQEQFGSLEVDLKAAIDVYSS